MIGSSHLSTSILAVMQDVNYWSFLRSLVTKILFHLGYDSANNIPGYARIADYLVPFVR